MRASTEVMTVAVLASFAVALHLGAQQSNGRPPAPAADLSPNDPLMKLLDRLRQAGIPMISADQLTRGYSWDDLVIPYEGHPTALQTRLVAAGLKRRLIADGQLN